MFKKIIITFFILLTIGLFILFRLHDFLSPIKPVADAKILVIDAWIDDKEMDEVVKIFKSSNYTYVLVPGGKLDRGLFFPGIVSVGDLSAIVLACKGIPQNKLTPLYVKQVKKDRTYQSALTVKSWMERNKVNSNIDVFTSSTHARRSWLLYRKAFRNECNIGIIAARHTDYDARHWWNSSNGFRTVVDESIAYLYAFLFFHPDL